LIVTDDLHMIDRFPETQRTLCYVTTQIQRTFCIYNCIFQTTFVNRAGNNRYKERI